MTTNRLNLTTRTPSSHEKVVTKPQHQFGVLRTPRNVRVVARSVCHDSLEVWDDADQQRKRGPGPTLEVKRGKMSRYSFNLLPK